MKLEKKSVNLLSRTKAPYFYEIIRVTRNTTVIMTNVARV